MNDEHLFQRVLETTVRKNGRHTENKILSIFLQTNFRCLLFWLVYNFVLFYNTLPVTSLSLPHTLLRVTCNRARPTQRCCNSLCCRIYILLDSSHYFYTLVLPINSSYSVQWSIRHCHTCFRKWLTCASVQTGSNICLYKIKPLKTGDLCDLT